MDEERERQTRAELATILRDVHTILEVIERRREVAGYAAGDELAEAKPHIAAAVTDLEDWEDREE